MNPNATEHWTEHGQAGAIPAPGRRKSAQPHPVRLTTHALGDEPRQSHAEVFYLQKQIQVQTPMVIVLVDGQRIEGCIEWYDRNALKVRGRTRVLIYKSAIKYMYKQGELSERIYSAGA